MTKAKHYKFDGVYKMNSKFATINLIPGYKSANEKLVTIDNVEYRIWDPWTSKPCAAFEKGLKKFPLKKGFKMLYLGFASGKTGSFFSDIIGKEGVIYAVEISERVLREAIPMAERRGNIVCLLNDARRPELYENIILERIDCLYVDVASPDQVAITIENAQKFLKPGGFVMIAIKSQSIDATKKPRQVYKECLVELEKHFEILDKVELDPYEKFHLFVVMKKK
ncbi:MAG: fibrillarin-like rRNA/tRNA 2'-O-methyltransferase [Candidatus Aenigmarchaeota archaeon]|nr:fibrillarin-like rRNA/tRNA 2'-O-methyltransferase [Candidatus Aenigmarchaeota archaeon]